MTYAFDEIVKRRLKKIPCNHLPKSNFRNTFCRNINWLHTKRYTVAISDCTDKSTVPNVSYIGVDPQFSPKARTRNHDGR